MENIRCKTCGGTVSRVNNSYVCDFCHNRWVVDASDDVQAVDRANAWSALRDADFEKASQLFENIILKEPNGHEAFWGRALSRNAIVYVTDLNENKKVPTCNNITEESFNNDVDVKKAISLAPDDIKESYINQANQIEKIRVEWLEKARKEPAYDVFISYKDSDRENNIERTQDSIDAQDLYNALIAEGYKVFFSRISLRDKIAEQYEPYIYNAIKTAKVMIVFGEKSSYFNSTWIKNEWSRFKTRIEKGEKHKNSLVVVYKGINPSELPVVLKSRQCLNASDMTFLSSLTKHIGKVIEQSPDTVRLDRIKIENVKIEKKAAKLSNTAIQTREIGAGAIAEIDISEQQTISLIKTYIRASQWHEADQIIEDALFNNPSLAEALWCKLLVKHKSLGTKELLANAYRFTKDDFALVESVLNCASQSYAEDILLKLYSPPSTIYIPNYHMLLEVILPYSFEHRQHCINLSFEYVIENRLYDAFTVLLNTLQADETERYIEYNHSYSRKATDMIEKTACMNSILSIDAGNLDAYQTLYNIALKNNDSSARLTELFESILKYSENTDEVIKSRVKYILNTLPLTCKEQCIFAKQALRYYPTKIDDLEDTLIELCYTALKNSFFEDSEYFSKLVLSFNKSSADAYFALCLIHIKAKSESDIINSDISIKKCAEFNKYLTLVDENRRMNCISLASKQENAINERHDSSIKVRELQLEQINKFNNRLLHVKCNVIKKYNFNMAIRFLQFAIIIGLLFATILCGATTDWDSAFEEEAPGFILAIICALFTYFSGYSLFGKEYGFFHEGGIAAYVIFYPIAISVPVLLIIHTRKVNADKIKALREFNCSSTSQLNNIIKTNYINISRLKAEISRIESNN